MKTQSIGQMTPEQFANHLYFKEKVPLDVVRKATGLTTFTPAQQIRSVTPALAPRFGSNFNNTPDPSTGFEMELKDAGHFKTVLDASESVLKLQMLLEKATNEGSAEAVYAVLNRALVTTCRASVLGKTAQARIFADWLKRVI